MVLWKLFAVLNLCHMTLLWPQRFQEEFGRFKAEFNLSFSCEENENLALNHYIENKNKIEKHNRIVKECNFSFDLGLWEKSYEPDVYINKILNGHRTPHDSEFSEVEFKAAYIGGYEIVPVPKDVTHFDWSKMGAVVPGIRRQGDCACCYALASTGAIEGQIFRKVNFLLKLSDQQIIDCSRDYGNRGCGTGNMESSFKYIKRNGIAAGRDYRFRMRELETCNYIPSMEKLKIYDYRRIRVKDDDFLKDLLYNIGPIAVASNGSLFSFLSYKSGIYNDPDCRGEQNHAMLLVGFGTDPAHGDYWILKNSYGSSWGEKGFIRMSRQIPNICSIRDYVVLPLL